MENRWYIQYERKIRLLSSSVQSKRALSVISEKEGIPTTDEDYRKYYSSFENLPFAFTDIEMVFNDESHAVDWIFRYGNSALAKLEKMSLEQL